MQYLDDGDEEALLVLLVHRAADRADRPAQLQHTHTSRPRQT